MNIIIIQFSLVVTETQGVEKHYRMQSESVVGGGEGVGGEEGVCQGRGGGSLSKMSWESPGGSLLALGRGRDSD